MLVHPMESDVHWVMGKWLVIAHPLLLMLHGHIGLLVFAHVCSFPGHLFHLAGFYRL
jgi:hypothetical protein